MWVARAEEGQETETSPTKTPADKNSTRSEMSSTFNPAKVFSAIKTWEPEQKQINEVELVCGDLGIH